MNKVIITDCDHSSIDIERSVLRKAGIELAHLCCGSEEDLIRECRGGAVMLNQYAPFTERVIRELSPELKLIVRYGVGVDNIDVAAATKYGVAVCNVPDYGMNEVADHAAAMALALERRLNIMVPHVRSGQWNYAESVPIHRFSEQTVGIVGLGRIGRMFARRMSGFGCRLMGFDAFYPAGSIVENLDAKRAFWEEISEIAPVEALFATNTSGLKITEIAKVCKYPERFMGQHWLNPPHLLPLCEIIAGEKTSQENVQKMRKLVEGLGKRPVVVADINGFIINRIQFAVLREALHIVDIGAATIEDVDTVLKAGMGLRYAALGPFGVADFGGLDTFDHINTYLNAELDDSKVGNKRLHEMVEAGKLGVKSGQGFYDYSGDKADEAIRERDRMYIELAKVLYFNKK